MLLVAFTILAQWPETSSGLMLATSCLANSAECQCSWKSGKFVADCSSQNLTKVPKNDYFDHLLESSGGDSLMPTLNRDIQALNLSSNQIVQVTEFEFAQKKFRNLQKIQLSHNKLASIEPGAFFKLTGLIELDLSDNLLQRLEANPEATIVEPTGEHHQNYNLSRATEASQVNKSINMASSSILTRSLKSFLQDLTQLRQLNLNSNKLKRIRGFTFSPAVQLRQLYLSRNNLQFIDKRAFDGLNELNILHLDGNKLTYLNGEILLKLPQLYALQLAGAENKWRCDCRLRKLVRLLLHNTGLKSAPSRTILQDSPRCFIKRFTSDELGQMADEQRQQQARQRRRRRRWLANDLDDEARPASWTSAPNGTLNGDGGKSIRLDESIVVGSSQQRRSDAEKKEEEEEEASDVNKVAKVTRSNQLARREEATATNDDGAETKMRHSPLNTNHRRLFRLERNAAESDDDHQDRHGRLWTSMRLNEFECSPQLVAEYLVSDIELDETKPTIGHGLRQPNRGADTIDSSSDVYSGKTVPAIGRQTLNQADEHLENEDNDKDGISMLQTNHNERDSNLASAVKSITLERQQFKANEPIELTCPIQLVDELDVELTRVEWLYQINWPPTPKNGSNVNQRQRQLLKLIWRSDNNNRIDNHNQAKRSDGNGGDDPDKRRLIMMKLDSGGRQADQRHGGVDDDDDDDDETLARDEIQKHWSVRTRTAGPIGADKFAIIDYVTRANASELLDAAGGGLDDSGKEVHAHDDSESRQSIEAKAKAAKSEKRAEFGPGNQHQANAPADKKALIRLVHLILEMAPRVATQARPKQMWFLCRVSNSAGQLRLWQPIELVDDNEASPEHNIKNNHNPSRTSTKLANKSDSIVDSQVELLLATSRQSSSFAPPVSAGVWARSERVRTVLEQEFANLETDRATTQPEVNKPLFVPLSITPGRLLTTVGGDGGSTSARRNLGSFKSALRGGGGGVSRTLDEDELDGQMAGINSLERSLIVKEPNQEQPDGGRTAVGRNPSQAKASVQTQDESSTTGPIGRNFGRRISNLQASNDHSNGGGGDIPEASVSTDDDGNNRGAPRKQNNVAKLLAHDWQDSNLRNVALALIGRFTSEKRSLIIEPRSIDETAEGDQLIMAEQTPFEGAGRRHRMHQQNPSSLGQLLDTAWHRQDQSFLARLGELYRILSKKFSETQASIPANLVALSQLLLGLLVGCLVTSVILLKFTGCLRDTDQTTTTTTTDNKKRPRRRRSGAKLSSKIADVQPDQPTSKCKSNSLTYNDGCRDKSNISSNDDDDDQDHSDEGDDEDYASDIVDRRAHFDRDSGEDDALQSYATVGSGQGGAPSCRHSNQHESDDGEFNSIVNFTNGPTAQHLTTTASVQQPPPPPPSGSTGSTATTTNGSQRMLLPTGSSMQNGQLASCLLESSGAAFGGLGSSHFFSLPRRPMIQKSSTLQNFIGINNNNYECLIGAVNCAANGGGAEFSPSYHSTTTSEAMSESNNRLDSILRQSTQINKTCTLGRPMRHAGNRTRSDRRRHQQQQQVNTNNKRTVTWLMSNDDIQSGQLQELSVGNLRETLDRLQAPTHQMESGSVINQPFGEIQPSGDRYKPGTSWTTPADEHGAMQTAGSCWIQQQQQQQHSDGLPPERCPSSLFTLSAVGGRRSQSLASNNGQQACNFLIADRSYNCNHQTFELSTSSGQKNGGRSISSDSGEICLLPACLCISSSSSTTANNSTAITTSGAIGPPTELGLNQDDESSYHLHSMFTTTTDQGHLEQSCRDRHAITRRHNQKVAGGNDDAHQHYRMGLSSIASPNATISTSSASIDRGGSVPTTTSNHGEHAIGQLDDALALLQSSLVQCEQNNSMAKSHAVKQRHNNQKMYKQIGEL